MTEDSVLLPWHYHAAVWRIVGKGNTLLLHRKCTAGVKKWGKLEADVIGLLYQNPIDWSLAHAPPV